MSKRPLFSRRTDWPLESNPLIQAVETCQKNKTPYIDLTESNPTRCGFHYPEPFVTSLCHPDNLKYSPIPLGQLNARQAVSEYYRKKGYAVSPERLILCASTSEAYSHLFRLLLNPEDRVLVSSPSYPLFQLLVELNDGQMDYFPLIEKDGWEIDLKAFEQALCPETKIVILVSPNNPTGSLLQSHELQEIKRICVERQITLICDEVFSDYLLTPRVGSVLSCVEESEILTFVLGGLSKSLGLPQMKLSWIAVNGPPDLIQTAIGRLEIIADTYLSVNTPAQNALKDWLVLQEVIQKEILKRLQKNFQTLADVIGTKSGWRLLPTEAGWYAVAKLPEGESEETRVLEFLEKDRVFVHPGYFFDFAEDGFLVLSLLPEPEAFKEGVLRILRRVSPSLG